MNIYQDCSDKSDSELVELSKSNPDYFSYLMYRYQDKLSAYIRRISYFNKEDIEDILQEVFIKVYKNLNDYEDALKFSSWIYRITRNHTIDQIRKNYRHPQTKSLEEGEFCKFIASSTAIEKDYCNKNLLQHATEIINDLPLKYREVLVLRFLEEKEYEEIMDILKKPKGTIATLIRRGKKLLEEEIKKLNLNN